MSLPVFVTVFLLMAAPAAGAPLPVQVRTAPDRVAEAERLLEAGQIEAAARLLGEVLSERPSDPRAARLLAKARYWLGDRAGARALYRQALAAHPGDAAIRYDYARMLGEIGERGEARRVAAPLRRAPGWEAHGDALLGMFAYWDGDLAGAARAFEGALRRDPALAEARRLLDEIRTATAPWLRLGGEYWHDDQPLDRQGWAFEAGWFPSPLTRVTGRTAGHRITAGGLASVLPAGQVEIRHVLPDARLHLDGSIGIARRPPVPGEPDWTASAEAGVRLPRGITPRLRIERAPYLHTVASLAAPVMHTTVSAGATLDHRGWMAEAEYRRRRYPDANEGWTAFGWVLAPVVRSGGGQLHAGYAFASSDTRAVRFSPDGRYDPYHTPLDQRTHAAVVAARWAEAGGVVLDVNLSAGLRGSETEPLVPGTPGAPLEFAERRFRPASIRLGVTLPITRAAGLALGAEAGRGSFYTWRAVSAGLTWRFVPRPDGR